LLEGKTSDNNKLVAITFYFSSIVVATSKVIVANLLPSPIFFFFNLKCNAFCYLFATLHIMYTNNAKPKSMILLPQISIIVINFHPKPLDEKNTYNALKY